MKIAIVVNSAWAAYNFRLNLALAINSEGHEVIFIIPYDSEYSKKLKKKFECHNLYLDSKGLNPFKDLKTFINLLGIYKKVKPDIVCHFTVKPNIYGSIAARVFKVSSLNNITGLGTLFISRNFATYVAKLLYRFSLSFSKKVFFQNTEDLNYFLQNKLICKSNSAVLPGSGVDLEKFKFSTTAVQKDKFVFLLISRLLRDKGIYEYIEAIRIIKRRYPEKSIEFQLLGEVGVNNRTAIKVSELEAWVNDDLICYLGVTDQVEKVISGSDCVVLPSYREGMPRSILEAFAVGRPAIVSDVPGCRDIVEHKINGLLCKVKSPTDLARKMITMMRISHEYRYKLSEKGRKKVECFFDEKIVIDPYIQSINNIATHEKII